jgi:opacity protein-like surface antigen
VSWTGGGTSATRLKDWLDPGNTGALTDDGDPHITTANGIHYNFQGAGEFVSLRDPDGLEIQTRQSPIATTFTPGPDPYDGVASCVSLNTAVAAHVAGHRVTYEPNLSGVPDPTGLQLRVDGVLTTLGSTGLNLGSGARIAQTSVPGGLEVDFPDNNVLYATPSWWASQSLWYLNVDVVHAPATDGTPGNGTVAQAVVAPPSTGGLMAAITSRNWLPTLPDGTQMGPLPASVSQRYTDLYNKFGNAWRITDATSLFDYAPGTSTSTFTVSTWPPQNAACTIPGVTPVQPTSVGVAEQACRQVTGKYSHADCVFDVIVTGNPGFANTYLASQQVVGSGSTGSTGPTTLPLNGRLAVFLDLGAGIPQGTFSSGFKTGFSFNGGLEYMTNSYVSIEGIFGYHDFPGKVTGNLNIYQFSANGKVYLVPPSNKLRPFLNGGIGDYTFSHGSSKFGVNVGGGVLYQLTSRFGLQGSYNFDNINTPIAATRFSTLQAGIRFVF